MKRRMIACLLAAALLFSLVGCQETPDVEQPVTEPAETTPPAPDPAQVYSEAVTVLNSATAVTLDVEKTTTTVVEDQSFEDVSQQVLTYAGLDTETPTSWMTEEVAYTEDIEAIAEEESFCTYSEIYAEGTLYVELEEAATFSGALSAEEYAKRYVPVVLLDAALYQNLTLQTEGDQTVIRFEDPTAAESWAIPETAQMIEASGSATVNADGTLQQMAYTVTYQYGPAEITLEVESEPRAEALSVVVPEDTAQYVPLQSIDALRTVLRNDSLLKNVESASVISTEDIFTQAAGVAKSQSAYVDLYSTGGDLTARVETGVHVMDPYNGDQSMTMEELFKDGKYVATVDDGIPTTQSGIDKDIVWEYCYAFMTDSVALPRYWKDVTVTDLGSTYLFEYEYSEDLGNDTQNTLCLLFWQDAKFLNNLASNYVNSEMNGYLAVDKYTGLMTASGLYYEGVHTIDGDDYILSLQKDQSVEIPSFGAYSAINEQLQPEDEPEQKATPLFYHVTGAEGQEMWLLGTIHVGDARTGFLPQEIYDAFEASDVLALEIDTEAFEEQLEEDTSLQSKVSKAYYYSDGSMTEDHLDEELYDQALKYLKACGGYSANSLYLKPSIWQSSIENFFLLQGHQLHVEQGVEERLTELAKEQDKPIREVESSLFQIQMLTGWSEELQQLLLEDTLSYSAEEYWTSVYELYELWCAGDEEALRKELSTEEDLSELTEEELEEYNQQLPLIEEYNKTMSFDRNEDMLDVAIEYLESGEVIFYAVGLAHLLDDTNGLVDALRAAGYTVELVTYYQ